MRFQIHIHMNLAGETIIKIFEYYKKIHLSFVQVQNDFQFWLSEILQNRKMDSE